jgi:hypothetical protein
MPQGITRARRQSEGEGPGPDGVHGRSRRARVLRACGKVERPNASPLGYSVLRFRWPAIEPHRDRGRRVGSLVSRALTPLAGAWGPGSATPVRQPGGCCVAPRGDIHAPEALLLRSLPQPMGAGSSRPLSPAWRAFMPHEGSVPRLQGRKTLASLPGQRPRERSPRDGKPTADDGATLRRKRAWRTETVE